jgi:hypothetical protein
MNARHLQTLVTAYPLSTQIGSHQTRLNLLTRTLPSRAVQLKVIEVQSATRTRVDLYSATCPARNASDGGSCSMKNGPV